MKTMEISIFLENTPGTLAKPAKILGEEGINILGLSLSTESKEFNYGLLRLIVDDPARAYQLLSQQGFMVITDEVIALEVPNVPGILAQITDVLSTGDLNVEYLFICTGCGRVKEGNVAVILKVIRRDEAVELLQRARMKVLGGEGVHG